jgi:hypothetical protein
MLSEIPKYIVLEPHGGVRLDIDLSLPACEIDAELDHPRRGVSFILMIGHRGGPFVQRARISGGARLLFDPEAPGTYVVLLVNPTGEPVVVHLGAEGVASSAAKRPRLALAGTSRKARKGRGSHTGPRSVRPMIRPRPRKIERGTNRATRRPPSTGTH